MSEAQTYSLAANLRWFAALYAAVTAVMVTLRLAANDTAFETPLRFTGWIVEVCVVAFAGLRFAIRNPTWTGAHRHVLALGYTVIIAAVSAISFATVLFIKPFTSPWPQDVELYLALAAACGIVAIAIYVITRLILTLIRAITKTKTMSGGIHA